MNTEYLSEEVVDGINKAIESGETMITLLSQATKDSLYDGNKGPFYVLGLFFDRLPELPIEEKRVVRRAILHILQERNVVRKGDVN